MEVIEIMSKRLNYFLAKKDMSRYRLSKLSGVSETSLDKLALRKSQAGNIKTLMKICRGLGITVSEFFNDPMFESEELNLD